MKTLSGALISTTHWLSHKIKLLPGEMRGPASAGRSTIWCLPPFGRPLGWWNGSDKIHDGVASSGSVGSVGRRLICHCRRDRQHDVLRWTALFVTAGGSIVARGNACATFGWRQKRLFENGIRGRKKSVQRDKCITSGATWIDSRKVSAGQVPQ